MKARPTEQDFEQALPAPNSQTSMATKLLDKEHLIVNEIFTRTDSTRLEKFEVLEETDLRKLESYLKVKDENRVLGNPDRIVTTESHVVCVAHYHVIYQGSASQKLREIIKANTGHPKEETSFNTLAKQFYTALVNTRDSKTRYHAEMGCNDG
ncbi:hypothetical protein BGZ65_010306 [Modicella reniformis]|uniref:Uncharacterized protein n=1 Tax=Modicella reniformis TaxID=1440133 RepID=A0A9P6LTK9_9FUNG|nr:hypothetical protein BGZ65_010306 [Modicella reniformis]